MTEHFDLAVHTLSLAARTACLGVALHQTAGFAWDTATDAALLSCPGNRREFPRNLARRAAAAWAVFIMTGGAP